MCGIGKKAYSTLKHTSFDCFGVLKECGRLFSHLRTCTQKQLIIKCMEFWTYTFVLKCTMFTLKCWLFLNPKSVNPVNASVITFRVGLVVALIKRLIDIQTSRPTHLKKPNTASVKYIPGECDIAITVSPVRIFRFVGVLRGRLPYCNLQR